MLKAIKVRLTQGRQYIPDATKAKLHQKFRGLPVLNDKLCRDCGECIKICPANAISINPLKIDIGKCVFCGDCANACKEQAIKFSNFHKLGTTSRDFLQIGSGIDPVKYMEQAVEVKKEIVKLFGRSLKLRSVSAGGCNGCELELNACSNVNFDMGRFGIEMVASPRHADGIVITGPISKNMASALETTLEAIPSPKLIIAMGSCAISAGVFANSPELERGFFKRHKVDLYLPGCPTHPLTFINGILALLGK